MLSQHFFVFSWFLAYHLCTELSLITAKEWMVECSCIRSSGCLTEAPGLAADRRWRLLLRRNHHFTWIHSWTKTFFICTYHRLSFLVKDGYFVLPLESAGGKYFGRTCSQNRSGRMITNDRPWGSQDMISDVEESAKISISFCGKISFFLGLSGETALPLAFAEIRDIFSSSSLTSTVDWGFFVGGSLTCNSVNADAASTSCDKGTMLGNDILLCLWAGAMVHIKEGSCFSAFYLLLHHTNYERRKSIFEIYLWWWKNRMRSEGLSHRKKSESAINAISGSWACLWSPQQAVAWKDISE